MACDNQPQNTEHNKQQKNHQRGAASIFGQAASQRELRRRSGVGKPKNQMSGRVQRVQRLRSWLTGLFMALPRPWELSIVGIQQDLLAHQFSAPKGIGKSSESRLHICEYLGTRANAATVQVFDDGAGHKKGQDLEFPREPLYIQDMRTYILCAEAAMSQLICKYAAGKLHNS